MGNGVLGLWAVVNGEIYNHVVLREELEREGCVFHSRSDSEVVLHGYKVWGEGIVPRLRGIFAIAVYDARRDRLLLARDAAGVKPLYFAHSHGGIVFASELKGVLAGLDGIPPVVSSAIWSYLAHRYVPGELTPYKSVYKLPPAHLLIREAGKVRIERWWLPRTQAITTGHDFSALDLGEEIEEVITAQLMSDAPVGVLLSGGIDSSVVTAFAAQDRADLHTFVCGFDERTHDERPYARLTADTFGVRLHETVMTWGQLRESLPDFIDWFDEPFFDYSAVAVHHLCRMARNLGIKVLLAGDGADEIFAGYLWYDDFAGEGSHGKAEDALERFFSYNGYFTREMLADLAGRPVEFDHLELLRRHDRPELPPVSRGQWLDFHSFFPDDILAKVDRASMAAGVEVRVPLVDQHILDRWFLLPQEVVYRKGERKALFKSAIAKVLPATILTNRKKGFGFPLGAWREPILHLARGLLTDGLLIAQGYASPKAIEVVLTRNSIDFVWLLLMVELWLRRYVAGEDLRRVMNRPGF